MKENALNIKRTMMWPTINKERENNLALSRLNLAENIKRSREDQAVQNNLLRERIQNIENKNELVKSQIAEMLEMYKRNKQSEAERMMKQ